MFLVVAFAFLTLEVLGMYLAALSRAVRLVCRVLGLRGAAAGAVVPFPPRDGARNGR